MQTTESHHIVRVVFSRFKAFDTFTINLRRFNILVGPNNAGKSTILTSFRILAAALRRAGAKKAEMVRGPQGNVYGYPVDLNSLSVAEENIFHNYDESIPATINFKLSNGNELVLYFPEQGTCNLIPECVTGSSVTPSAFRAHFNCAIGFVPILGPVEHHESLFEKEAARLALFNYRAARNFRNIWYHYPEKFEEFRTALIQTWPGMDIERPKLDLSHQKPRLHMFCPENRIPREIFWAGFGFQVWCQMLTHLIQSSDKALFLIDEPDIYLHSDLQRQLLGLLRNLGPDVLIATHSTEIITEAEADDIVLVNKHRKIAQRIKNPSQLVDVFKIIGSNINPILTQLAKTRRAVFVEGKDFQIVSKFARKLNCVNIANRSDFAVVPVEGFNPDRVRSLKRGMETTLGTEIMAAIVLDRDYRCIGECEAIAEQCKEFCDMVVIHECKEIENFLLVPEAIDRAASRRIVDQIKRGGRSKGTYSPESLQVLERFASEHKSYVVGQYLADRKRFERINAPNVHEATVNQAGLDEFEARWTNAADKFRMIPGKEALSSINGWLQDKYSISVTPTAIIDVMRSEEVPVGMQQLVQKLSQFASSNAVLKVT